MSSTERDDKASLRASLRSMLDDVHDEQLVARSKAVCERLLHVGPVTTSRSIMLFAAKSGEVDLSDAHRALVARGVDVFYPRVDGDHLMVVHVHAETPFAPGFAGVREPVGEVADPEILDAVVVPGLAFDLHGGRLGRGRGFFDRFLARAPEAARVGVCLAEQVVAHVPTEAHDQRVDLIVTDVAVHLSDRRGPKLPA